MHMLDWNAYRQQVVAGVGYVDLRECDREHLTRDGANGEDACRLEPLGGREPV